MPLHATLSVNDKHLLNIHISRMRSYPSGVNDYAVIATEMTVRANGETYEPEWGEYLNDGVPFQHNESEGALMCLSKALQAWTEVNP